MDPTKIIQNLQIGLSLALISPNHSPSYIRSTTQYVYGFPGQFKKIDIAYISQYVWRSCLLHASIDNQRIRHCMSQLYLDLLNAISKPLAEPHLWWPIYIYIYIYIWSSVPSPPPPPRPWVWVSPHTPPVVWYGVVLSPSPPVVWYGVVLSPSPPCGVVWCGTVPLPPLWCGGGMVVYIYIYVYVYVYYIYVNK